jgi:hypothetical protein
MKRDERKNVKTSTNQTHANPHQDEANNHERHISGSINVRGVIEAKRPPDLTEEHNAERKEDKASGKKKFVVEILTLIVLGIYTLATGYQSYLTRTAINNNSDQFQTEQRPYVWDTGLIPPENVHVAPNEIATFAMKWINYGKSPAVKVTQRGSVWFGTLKINPMQDVDVFFDRLDGKKVNLAEIIRSQGGSPWEIQLAEALQDKPLPVIEVPQNIIPPGIPPNTREPFGNTTVLRTDDPLPNLPEIFNNDRMIVGAGRTEYFDLSGKRYWSDFCFMRMKDGSIVKCLKHNEMH